MKRIVIDGDLCQGTKECAALLPNAIAFDASGVAHLGPNEDGVIDDELADLVAATCPSMAITVEVV